MNGSSKTQDLAVVAMFGALAYALRLAVDIPFPLASYLKLELWEIPVYIALVAFGLKPGLGVAAIMYLMVQFLESGPLPTGAVYNLVAVLSTLLGMQLVLKLAGRRSSLVSLGLASTASSVVLRVAVMTVVNYLALPMPYPIGFSIPVADLPPILGITAVFNALVAAYSVGIATVVAAAAIRIAPSAGWRNLQSPEARVGSR